MKDDAGITAEQILTGKASAIPRATRPDTAIPTISPAEVTGEFRRRFEKRPDVGIWKRFSNTILAAPNPFVAKSRRRVRREAIILGTLVLMALALATYFNLNALPR